jgi:hypothetical protein
MDKSTGQNATNSSKRVKLGTTMGHCDGRTIGSQKTGPVTKVKLDSSKVLGSSVEGRSVGGKKSGSTGKVHFDPSKIMASTTDGKTVGSAKTGGTGK